MNLESRIWILGSAVLVCLDGCLGNLSGLRRSKTVRVVETYKGVFRALCLISVFYCLFDVY
jgi:hypothetical protein